MVHLKGDENDMKIHVQQHFRQDVTSAWQQRCCSCQVRGHIFQLATAAAAVMRGQIAKEKKNATFMRFQCVLLEPGRGDQTESRASNFHISPHVPVPAFLYENPI